MNPPRIPQARTRTPHALFLTLTFVLALLLAGCQQTDPGTHAPREEATFSSPNSVSGNKALVLCPPTDSGGCDRIAAQLAHASNDAVLVFGGGVNQAYAELRDMPLAQLQQYAVVFVPSLANAPYDLLREDVVQTRLQQILGGRVVVWSGTPDRGTLRGASAGKLDLIENLARWAAAGFTAHGSAGLVVLQDFSDAHGDGTSPRYDWVQGIAGVRVEPDSSARSYDRVETNTSNPAADPIVGALAYDDMASFGLTLPQPSTEIGAWGQDVRGKRITRGPIVLGTVMRDPATCETVGVAGGVLTVQSGSVVLAFPEGALTEDWCVSVAPANAEGAGYVQNTAYSFGPSGLSFTTPAVLSIAYAESDIPDGGSESNLAMHTFNAGAWTEAPGSVVDAANNTVTTPSFDQPNQHAIFLRGLTPPPSGGGSGKPADGVAVAPASGDVAAGGLRTLTATVIDKQGNPLSGKIVTWSSTNGGSFSTTTGTTDDRGEAATDFTAATVAATQHLVTATVESQTGTSALTVVAGPAAKLAFTEQPSDAQAGAAISPAVQVTAQDDHGNTVTEYVAEISLAITTETGAAGATLSGVATIAATAGVATFTDPSITTAGTGYTLDATSGNLTVTSDAFDIAPAAPASLTVAPSTATIAAGATQAFTATVEDPYGNVIAGPDVTWSLSDVAVATVAPVTGTSTTATAALDTLAPTVVTITATSVADPSVSGSAGLTVHPACDDAGWRVELAGPALDEVFFAIGSTFEAVWTHEPANPTCATAPAAASYAWTMNGEPLLSPSSTAEVAALGYAGGIYAASGVETVVDLEATVGTAPAVTAARTLRPRPTTPIGITVTPELPPCEDAFCEFRTHAVFENPDGDDEALAFEWWCLTKGGVRGGTYCNEAFAAGTDYFPPDQTDPTALLFGRVGVCYAIVFRVGKAYDDQWSAWTHYATFEPGRFDAEYSTCEDGYLIRTASDSTRIEVGATHQFITYVDVTWSSSDEGVATVAPDGTVTGVALGTAVLRTIRTSDSSLRTYRNVTVIEANTDTGVNVVEGDQSIEVGETYAFTAFVDIEGATNSVTWTSDDESVATVAANGAATGVGVGQATITATSRDHPDESGSVTVTVAQGSVTGVRIVEGDQSIEVGSTFRYAISATGTTTGIPSTDVTWTSDAESVATVAADGTVAGVAEGVAAITATSTVNPAVSDTVTVTVTETSSVTRVSIDQGDQSVEVAATYDFTASVGTTGTASGDVIWSTGDETVATVTLDGTVTGVATGVAQITATSVFDATQSDSVGVTVTTRSCDDAGWRVGVGGPAAEPYFAQSSTFEATWTHESGDPVCGAPTVAVAYAWTMNAEPLSSSSTAEIPALGYAGGIYSASGVETVVELGASVGTAPAVTAARTLRPRSTTPIAFTANQIQRPDCQDTYCEITTHPVFYNPDGDDELVFEYLCSASGGIAGETYCNSTFVANTDYFPPDQTGPTAFLNGRVGMHYTIAFRVRKAYEDPTDPASWSRYESSSYVYMRHDGSIQPTTGVVVQTGNPSVVINEGDRSIGVGGTISYTISASDVDAYGFDWSSDDVSSCDTNELDFWVLCGTGNGIATVGTDGIVTGVAEGIVLITATSKWWNMYRYSVIVTVTNN